MNGQSKFFTDTRITGLLYLGLALTGFFVLLFARSNIYVDDDAIKTTSNILEKETLARFGVAVELALVMFQAFVAIWFYKLFKKLGSFKSGMIAVFGLVNAIAILVASAMWLGALNASLSGASAEAVYTLFNLHETIWLVSGIFFGLWLLPMGYLAIKSKMPSALGWFLIVGGIGYILSTLILVLSSGQQTLADILILPSTVGELWMVGYLIIKPQLNTSATKTGSR
jgi:Domain of unknown function (DUF4386)